MDKRLSTLVVSGGGIQGFSILKGLRADPQIRIILADCYKENIGRYFVDRAYVVPKISEVNEFIDAVVEICGREEVKLLFPSTERDLEPLATYKARFERLGTHLALPELDLLKELQNKRSLTSFLMKHEIPVPKPVDITADEIAFPIIGKKELSWGARGMLLIENKEQLQSHNLYELSTCYIWQQYYPNAPEYSVDFAIDLQGRVSRQVIRRRSHISCGFATVTDIAPNPEVEKICSQLIRLLVSRNARGIFNAQFLQLPSACLLIDLNARIGTSGGAGMYIGENFPLFVCKSLTFEPESITSSEVKHHSVKVVRYLEELEIPKLSRDQFRAIAFDLDDTLIDQKRWILAKLELVWKQCKVHLPEQLVFLEAALATLEEGDKATLYDRLSQRLDLNEQICKTMIDAHRVAVPDEIVVPADVPTALDRLKSMGFFLALITDNPPTSQKQKVALLPFRQLFDCVVYTRTVGAEKPALNGFEEIVRRAGVESKSCIMVGDNLYRDILGASRAEFGFAFWITREGFFYNQDRQLFANISGGTMPYCRQRSLRYLPDSFCVD